MAVGDGLHGATMIACQAIDASVVQPLRTAVGIADDIARGTHLAAKAAMSTLFVNAEFTIAHRKHEQRIDDTRFQPRNRAVVSKIALRASANHLRYPSHLALNGVKLALPHGGGVNIKAGQQHISVGHKHGVCGARIQSHPSHLPAPLTRRQPRIITAGTNHIDITITGDINAQSPQSPGKIFGQTPTVHRKDKSQRLSLGHDNRCRIVMEHKINRFLVTAAV